MTTDELQFLIRIPGDFFALPRSGADEGLGSRLDDLGLADDVRDRLRYALDSVTAYAQSAGRGGRPHWAYVPTPASGRVEAILSLGFLINDDGALERYHDVAEAQLAGSPSADLVRRTVTREELDSGSAVVVHDFVLEQTNGGIPDPAVERATVALVPPGADKVLEYSLVTQNLAAFADIADFLVQIVGGVASTAPRFALPGTWGRINLASEATMRSSTRTVIERSVGRNDQLASLRADLKKRFHAAGELARANGAVDFHIALELAPGVPLPAWLAVFLPIIEAEDLDRLGPADFTEVLNLGLSVSQDGVAKATTTLESTHLHAVRQAFRRFTAATEDEPALELLQVDYWLAAAEPNRIVLLTFTTHLVEYESQMLELFDAVIATVRWPAPSESVTKI